MLPLSHRRTNAMVGPTWRGVKFPELSTRGDGDEVIPANPRPAVRYPGAEEVWVFGARPVGTATGPEMIAIGGREWRVPSRWEPRVAGASGPGTWEMGEGRWCCGGGAGISSSRKLLLAEGEALRGELPGEFWITIAGVAELRTVTEISDTATTNYGARTH